MPRARASAILIAVVASSVSIVGVVSHAEPSENHINTVREIRAGLRACWIPPITEVPRMNITIFVRLSFKQNGEILGIPLMTYTTPGISEDERRAYRAALNETLARCSPLAFSDAFRQHNRWSSNQRAISLTRDIPTENSSGRATGENSLRSARQLRF
jgi:hypothetical protein